MESRVAEYIEAFRSGHWLIGSTHIHEAVLEMADEIERLQKVVRAADRLHHDTMYKWAPEAKDFYIRERATVRLQDSAGDEQK